MNFHQQLSRMYSCPTGDYHEIAKVLLTDHRKNEEFALNCLKEFLKLPLSMNSQRILEIINQIPLGIYKSLLKKLKNAIKKPIRASKSKKTSKKGKKSTKSMKSMQNWDLDEKPIVFGQIIGSIELLLGNYKQADRELQKIIKLSPENIHTKFLQSNSARLQFKFAEAISILDFLLEKEPQNALIFNRLGMIALDHHNYSKAEEYFTKSWKVDGIEFNKKGLKMKSEKKKALKLKSDTSKSESDKISYKHNHSLLQLVWIKNEFQNFDQAQILLDRAKKNDNRDPYLYNSLGDLKRYQNDSLGSIEAYTTALDLNPYEPLFWKNLSLMYMEIGEYKQALITIKELMKLDPDKIEPWITYAWYYEEKNEFQMAIEKIEEGLKKNPNCPELYIEIARCYDEMDDGLNEFKYLQKAMDSSPNNINVLNGVAYYFLNNDDTEAAEEIFLKILQLDPENISALNGLSTLKYDVNHDVKAAEKYLKRSIKIDSSNLQTWIQYGQLEFHEERFIQAEKYFKKALAINPQHSSVLHYLGLISWGIHDDLKRAENYFTKALEYEDDNISISLDLIELYRTGLNQIEKAKDITKKLLQILPDDKYLKQILDSLR